MQLIILSGEIFGHFFHDVRGLSRLHFVPVNADDDRRLALGHVDARLALLAAPHGVRAGQVHVLNAADFDSRALQQCRVVEAVDEVLQLHLRNL